VPKRSIPESWEVNYQRYSIVYEWILYSGITGEAVKLYAVLQRFSNKEGEAWPGLVTIAERFGMGERSVQRYMSELTKIDAVRVESRVRANGSSRSSIYHLWPYEKPGFNTTDQTCQADEKEVNTTDAPVNTTDLTPLERTLINEHQSNKKKGRPRKNPEPKYTPEFEEFFSLYPKPVMKEQTFKNWEWSTDTKGIPFLDIIAALSAYLKEIERKGTEFDWIIKSTNFVGRNQRWMEYAVSPVSSDILAQAWAWEAFDTQPGPGTILQPDFPRPQNSEGHLLDSTGRAYYIDQMDFKRRYVDDE
jgi:Helix-turn-helix domain